MSAKRFQVFLTAEEYGWIRQMRALKTCAEKVGHDTKAGALRSAISQMLRIKDKAPKLDVYLCPHCGKWHLTKAR